MGRSFVSMYTPRPKGAPPEVKWAVGRFGVSRQLMADLAVDYERVCMNAIHDMVASEQERLRNGHIGPMHRPTRRDFDAILRAERVREYNRQNIAALGRPAGQFRRAS